jgi:hypothetical protein
MALLGLLLAFLLPAQAPADGLMRVESTTMGAARNNANNQLELPFYEMMAAAYNNEKRDLELNLNFSLFDDPTTAGSTQAKLYLLDAKFSAIPDRLIFRVGRTLDTQHTIGINSADLIAADYYLFEKQLSLGAFYGLERRIEAVGSMPSANIWGTDLHFHSDDTLPYFLTAKFEQRQARHSDDPRETRVELSAQKGTDWEWNPEFLLDSVTNVDQHHLDRLEGGVDLYPTAQTLLKLRGMSYELLPLTGLEQPIYSIFAAGRLFEERAQMETKMNRLWIVSLAAFHDRFPVVGNSSASGLGGEFENRLKLETFNLIDTVYAFRSYGGDVFGNRITARQETFRNNEIYGVLDLTKYSKITSSKRYAISSELGWGSVLGKLFKLTVGGEFNSNNTLKYDVRAMTKLVFLMWNEI